MTESPVSKMDQVATNGVVQVLDKVMYPPKKTLQGTLKEKQFSTFFGMIEQTDVIAYLISSMFVISSMNILNALYHSCGQEHFIFPSSCRGCSDLFPMALIYLQ